MHICRSFNIGTRLIIEEEGYHWSAINISISEENVSLYNCTTFGIKVTFALTLYIIYKITLKRRALFEKKDYLKMNGVNYCRSWNFSYIGYNPFENKYLKKILHEDDFENQRHQNIFFFIKASLNLANIIVFKVAKDKETLF